MNWLADVSLLVFLTLHITLCKVWGFLSNTHNTHYFPPLNNRSSSASLGRQQWRRDNSATNIGLISSKYFVSSKSWNFSVGEVKTSFFNKGSFAGIITLCIFNILLLTGLSLHWLCARVNRPFSISLSQSRSSIFFFFL